MSSAPLAAAKRRWRENYLADCFIEKVDWPRDRAVIDCFNRTPSQHRFLTGAARIEELSIKEITGLLTAVGFSSPPSWIKPYQVLSGGERFRCDLARALSGTHPRPPLVAFDEFTSVVDRNVAKIGSAAVAKGIRSGQIRCRFVAVTCHYDILDWLEPDWVIDMATREFQRRSLRRPAIRLEIFRCQHRVWEMFKRHHYLSGNLSRAARCFVALWRSAGVVLRHAAGDRQEKSLANFAHRDAARFSRHRHRDARGGSGGQFASGRRTSAQRDRQPSGAHQSLPPLTKVARDQRQENRLASHRAFYTRLPQQQRPRGGVV